MTFLKLVQIGLDQTFKATSVNSLIAMENQRNPSPHHQPIQRILSVENPSEYSSDSTSTIESSASNRLSVGNPSESSSDGTHSEFSSTWGSSSGPYDSPRLRIANPSDESSDGSRSEFSSTFGSIQETTNHPRLSVANPSVASSEGSEHRHDIHQDSRDSRNSVNIDQAINENVQHFMIRREFVNENYQRSEPRNNHRDDNNNFRSSSSRDSNLGPSEQQDISTSGRDLNIRPSRRVDLMASRFEQRSESGSSGSGPIVDLHPNLRVSCIVTRP